MRIVIVNGSPRCGKDTFCNFVQKMLGEHRCAIFSTVDKMKEIAGAMVKILSDSQIQEKFSQNSIRIANKHDFEKTLDKFQGIYQEVMKNN